MWELDVDAHIKNYWKKIEEAGAVVFEKQFKQQGYEKYGGSRTDFYNPDDSRPMRLPLFLSFMDVTPLEDAMKPYYKRLKSVKYLPTADISQGCEISVKRYLNSGSFCLEMG